MKTKIKVLGLGLNYGWWVQGILQDEDRRVACGMPYSGSYEWHLKESTDAGDHDWGHHGEATQPHGDAMPGMDPACMDIFSSKQCRRHEQHPWL